MDYLKPRFYSHLYRAVREQPNGCRIFTSFISIISALLISSFLVELFALSEATRVPRLVITIIDWCIAGAVMISILVMWYLLKAAREKAHLVMSRGGLWTPRLVRRWVGDRMVYRETFRSERESPEFIDDRSQTTRNQCAPVSLVHPSSDNEVRYTPNPTLTSNSQQQPQALPGVAHEDILVDISATPRLHTWRSMSLLDLVPSKPTENKTKPRLHTRSNSFAVTDIFPAVNELSDQSSHPFSAALKLNTQTNPFETVPKVIELSDHKNQHPSVTPKLNTQTNPFATVPGVAKLSDHNQPPSVNPRVNRQTNPFAEVTEVSDQGSHLPNSAIGAQQKSQACKKLVTNLILHKTATLFIWKGKSYVKWYFKVLKKRPDKSSITSDSVNSSASDTRTESQTRPDMNHKKSVSEVYKNATNYAWKENFSIEWRYVECKEYPDQDSRHHNSGNDSSSAQQESQSLMEITREFSQSQALKTATHYIWKENSITKWQCVNELQPSGSVNDSNPDAQQVSQTLLGTAHENSLGELYKRATHYACREKSLVTWRYSDVNECLDQSSYPHSVNRPDAQQESQTDSRAQAVDNSSCNDDQESRTPTDSTLDSNVSAPKIQLSDREIKFQIELALLQLGLHKVCETKH